MHSKIDQTETGRAGSERRAFRKAWGAEFLPGQGALFRIWAPAAPAVGLRLEGEDLPMAPAGGGWFERLVADPGKARQYGFVLPDGLIIPDPASRAQAKDVHGPSLLIDPLAYEWQNRHWRGRPWHEAVIYELHVGTFTDEGTFQAAIGKLQRLAELGFTAIELMPVNQFGGERGWGYEGVLPFAPHHAYGAPDDMKALVDAAHGHGLMVMLDVVYNHFGPVGNYIPHFAPEFFDSGRHTPWGNSIDFSRPEVRRFFLDNACYWVEEFFLDGLRLDAVDELVDESSAVPILEELAMRVREGAAGRDVHLTIEDPLNRAGLIDRSADALPLYYEAAWNDDMHHAMQVALTDVTTGFFADFADKPWRWLQRSLAEGFGYQGEVQPSRGKSNGEVSTHLPPTAFIDFLQNHDQIGNRAKGDRLRAFVSREVADLASAMLLLSPHIPLVFMGEEFGSKGEFHFFSDHPDEIAKGDRAGRVDQVRNFGTDPEEKLGPEDLTDPNAPETFARSKVDWHEADTAEGKRCLALYRRLLDCRRAFIMPHLGHATGGSGASLTDEEGVLALNWRLGDKILQMRANFTDRSRQLPAAEGEVVFMLPDEAGPSLAADSRLPPLSIVVTLV